MCRLRRPEVEYTLEEAEDAATKYIRPIIRQKGGQGA